MQGVCLKMRITQIKLKIENRIGVEYNYQTREIYITYIENKIYLINQLK